MIHHSFYNSTNSDILYVELSPGGWAEPTKINYPWDTEIDRTVRNTLVRNYFQLICGVS